MNKYLFLVASARPEGQAGNSEKLAQAAASHLPKAINQKWINLAQMNIPDFVDQSHSKQTYSMPKGDLKTLLDATMDCTNLVLVTPVYWMSYPASLKKYLEHWSEWMRIPSVPFKEEMSKKHLHLIATSAIPGSIKPLNDSTRLCAEFLNMTYSGVLEGLGGALESIYSDPEAMNSAEQFFQ